MGLVFRKTVLGFTSCRRVFAVGAAFVIVDWFETVLGRANDKGQLGSIRVMVLRSMIFVLMLDIIL